KLTSYRVPHARPIVTGPGAPTFVSITNAKMTLLLRRAGTYRIAVRWSPYWRASHGCLWRGKDGMLRLSTLQPRLVRLSFVVSADSALDPLTGTPRRRTTVSGCAEGRRRWAPGFNSRRP